MSFNFFKKKLKWIIRIQTELDPKFINTRMRLKFIPENLKLEKTGPNPNKFPNAQP